MTVSAEAPRPAFYALAPGSWRDYATLLHPPYTAWHLSYVAIGAALAPDFRLSRLLPTLAAFFLAVGIGAHALDELHGRPLRTELGSGTLALLAVLSIAGAVAIGVYAAVAWSPWIAVFAPLGAFILCAYNLELFGGRFHTDTWFALSWGAFPLVTGFFAVAERITPAAIVAGAFAFALSLAQRRLSTQVRHVRRHLREVRGTIVQHDGTSVEVNVETLIGAEERALKLLTAATVLLALSLVMMRLA
ncbi:MAG TPA: hypothetical protein VNB88_00605 [Gaiellaceae bacterium]|nr:hypothetical protein [Gaiellaceae bacterium]